MLSELLNINFHIPFRLQPISCTEIGCYGKQAGPDCKNVFEYRPDGWGCFPLCRICLDRAKSPTRPREITSAVRLVEESTVTAQTATDISTNASIETSTHQMSTETSTQMATDTSTIAPQTETTTVVSKRKLVEIFVRNYCLLR